MKWLGTLEVRIRGKGEGGGVAEKGLGTLLLTFESVMQF